MMFALSTHMYIHQHISTALLSGTGNDQ